MKVSEKVLKLYSNAEYLFKYLVGLNIFGAIIHLIMYFLKSQGRVERYIDSRYLWGYFVFNVLAVVLLLVFKRKIIPHIRDFSEWNKSSGFNKEKAIISTCFISIITIFCLKMHLGFYFYGIAGWVEVDITGRAVSSQASVVEDSDAPKFLYKSIITENIQYSPSDYINLVTNVQFLHYEGDIVLPTNYDLTSYVFDFVIVDLLLKSDNLHVLESIVKKAFEVKRPSWYYPNHSPYMKIDYSKYPSANKLKAFSSWDVIYHVNKQTKNVTVKKANLSFKYDFKKQN